MFFAVAPDRALLSDLNADLMGAFRIVAERPADLLEEIRALPINADTYYRLREAEPEEPFRAAVRLIYLNRTCYGGIYRENKQGKFNTPYGGGSRTTTPLWERSLIEACAPLLAKEGIALQAQDFETSMALAGEGDIVYCDPAYRAATRAQFDRYGALIFGWEDQIRLARAAALAKDRGALVVISNTYCPEVRDLYDAAIRIQVERNKAIGNASKEPNRRKEYLIVLHSEYEPSTWARVGRIEE
jgi:DNA adenine methylase